MACYHPLFAYKSRFINPETGKAVLRFQPPTHDMDKWEPVQLPCGQCLGCRLEYSRQWANRLMLELESHDSAFFCTFTYDDDHVPIVYYDDPETGEAFPAMTLRKRDAQLLTKRIRRHFPEDKIRFYMSGEYGDESFRPHYHYILFGLHLDDLVFYKRVKEGDCYFIYYNSPKLQSCWLDDAGKPIGYVVVGEVSWESCAYVARYVMKKVKGKGADFYAKHNLEPEFALMSRRPGIAREYYESHPDCYDKDFINISTPKGGKKFRPPRYFQRLFEIDEPEKSAELREIRKCMAEECTKAKLAHTSLEYNELLEVQETKMQNRLKPLRRNLL